MIHIVSGEEMLQEAKEYKIEGTIIPFNEAMVDGNPILPIFEEDFIQERCKTHQIKKELYLEKTIHPLLSQLKETSEIHLHFGYDMFCQINCLTLLAYLDQIHYTKPLLLSIYDEPKKKEIEMISINSNGFLSFYESIMIKKESISTPISYLNTSIDFYFNYYYKKSIIKEYLQSSPNIALLLKNYPEYGLGDIQWYKWIQSTKEPHKMKAAIFDMDGLMYDTEKIATSAWLQVSKEQSFPLTKEQVDYFRGSNKEFKRVLFAKWYGPTFDYEKAFHRVQEVIEEYFKSNPVPVKKGLLDLLNALKEKGYKIAIATSTSRDKAERYWKSTHVLEFIDANICGNEVTKSKPDPEIFLKAAKKLEVNIEECYVLEDSPNGLKAGHLAGATTIMIPDLTKPTEEIKSYCNYIFEDLTKVIPIL